MKNAIYLDYSWFSGKIALTDYQRNDYVKLLHGSGINQQFCDIGTMRDNGTLSAVGYSKLKDWIKISRQVDSSQKIILAINYGCRKTNEQFGSSAFNTNLNNIVSKLLNTYDIDGIHLDIEGFIADDTVLLSLLKVLKVKSLSSSHLSISTPVSVWTDSYIKQVVNIVDQVNPMIYDTMGWGSDVMDEDSYKNYFLHHILHYAELLQDTDCELVPTLPCYELKVANDETIYHDPKVESMPTAIAALNEAINNGAIVSGAGIFWGSHYLGLYPNVYNLYQQDQEAWKLNWLKTQEVHMKTLFLVIYYDTSGRPIGSAIIDHYPTDEEIKTLLPVGSMTGDMYYANVEKRYYFI